jgi:hypothetical protein
MAATPYHPLDWHRGVWCPIVGGLANQLICYRIGRMLADVHQLPLFVDLSHFQNPGTRPLLIQNFSPIVDVAFHDPNDTVRWATKTSDLLEKVTKRNTPHFWDSDTQSNLRNLYLQTPETPILADLWVGLAFTIQAREYFRLPQNQAKMKFDENCLTPAELLLRDSIKKSEHSIAVHIRRTDFAVHDGGLLAAATQYNESISHIERLMGPCEIFVFSDDHAWCEQNLKAIGPISHSPARGEENGHKDLYLASLCRHKVLTNESTFSQLIDATSPNYGPERLIARCSARLNSPLFEEYYYA